MLQVRYLPEFKLVISDPKAKNVRPFPVIVEADDSLEYAQAMKDQEVLPSVKLNPKIVDILNPELGVVIVRIWKNRANREKVTLAAKIIQDPQIDPQTVRVPAGFMAEKVGSQRVLGEVFRAPAFQLYIKGAVAARFVGLKIGDRIPADIIGFPGKYIVIRGGSDRAGFPMRPDVPGAVKKYLLLSSGPGFRPREDGERRRKLVRGNTISDEIVQINAVIV